MMEIAACADHGINSRAHLVRITTPDCGAPVEITPQDLTGTELIGPAPCYYTRENNLFRWQLLLRGPDPVKALEGLQPRKGWYIDIDPLDVL